MSDEHPDKKAIQGYWFDHLNRIKAALKVLWLFPVPGSTPWQMVTAEYDTMYPVEIVLPLDMMQAWYERRTPGPRRA